MSSISIKEMELLQQWAVAHQNENIFQERFSEQVEKNSYFRNVEKEENYIMEYDFHNIIELEKMFEKYWGNNTDAPIRKAAAVAAFKQRAKNAQSMPSGSKENDQQSDQTSKIPEYIYVF